ncbi:class I adenylate-forming enzyme family protein [Loktanella sp. DJP18]|uniref:class I adenylate-forming enzyme family protein n=1 Tax=Loktanella sp. DJP18 TaxID=3409788 RepID=UPI003BB62BE0
MLTSPPPRFNMAAHVLAQAGLRAGHPALIVPGGKVWSYADLEQAVRGTATGLLTRAHPGDRILMRLGNTPDFPITYLACIAAGLIPVPTSSQLTTPEVTKMARELSPALIVQADGIAAAEGNWPILPATALPAMRALPQADYAMGEPDRPAYIVYTSGTSGQARAVVHAHRAIWARRMMWDGWYGLTADDRVLHAGAFNWTYTLGTGLMDPWSVGATAIIPPDGTDAATLPALLTDHAATIFAAAPGVYRRILRQRLSPVLTLRHGLSAGEMMPDTLRAAWMQQTGTPIHEAFGMSEISTFISGSPMRPAPPGTLGYPQPGRQVALWTPDGPADHGQIAVHRSDPGLMLGYFGQPDETAARYSGDWFLTGDEGTRDASGAIAYAGRADDMMNAGGTRVSPVEVEAVLSIHPRITEVACAEVRVSPELSLIAAFYTAPDLLDDAELTRFAAGRLAAYKVPRIFVHRDAMPRGANNKLLRRALRREWEAAYGQA